MMRLLDRIKKVKSKNFMEAVAAASAMVAFADGLVRPEEVDKLLEYVRMDENLKVFDALEVMEAFEKHIHQFEFDFQIGKEKAVKTIRRIDRNTEEDRLLILVCIAIGNADGEFNNNQRLVIREICRILGMDHRQFDLPLRAPCPEDFPKAKEARTRKIPPSHLPEWMKNPPKPDTSPKKEDRMPDWMRHPPRLPESSKQKEKVPESMRHSPKMQPPEKKDSMPDWMKHPPRLAASSEEKEKLPDRMRNPPKMQQTEKKDSMPDWMKNPPKMKQPEKKDSMPDWMKNPRHPQHGTEKTDNIPEWMRHPPGSSEKDKT